MNLATRRSATSGSQKNGIDPAKYDEIEKSFTVATKMKRAKQLTAAYKVDGVPRVVVNGKYFTAAELAGGSERVFPVVDQLIAMARKEARARRSRARRRKK